LFKNYIRQRTSGLDTHATNWHPCRKKVNVSKLRSYERKLFNKRNIHKTWRRKD